MKYKCIIVDDEPLARKVIREYVEELKDFEIPLEAKNVVEAQKILDSNEVDVMFLDINMPKISGVEWLKSRKDLPVTIFTTAYSEFAVDAFELDALDYLVKPISFSRFLKTISKLRLRTSDVEDGDRFISIREGKRIYKVAADAILYVQAYGDYVKIFSKEKIYVVKYKLVDFHKTLGSNFLQVHRSYIVNVDHITYIEGNHLVIHDEQIPVSNSHKEELKKKM